MRGAATPRIISRSLGMTMVSKNQTAPSTGLWKRLSRSPNASSALPSMRRSSPSVTIMLGRSWPRSGRKNMRSRIMPSTPTAMAAMKSAAKQLTPNSVAR